VLYQYQLELPALYSIKIALGGADRGGDEEVVSGGWCKQKDVGWKTAVCVFEHYGGG
jgi:hypothetical protein